MKFKKGDRVALVEDWIPYGTKGKVIRQIEDEVEVMFEYVIFPFDGDNGKITWVPQDTIEFEHIFNSPLYQALR